MEATNIYIVEVVVSNCEVRDRFTVQDEQLYQQCMRHATMICNYHIAAGYNCRVEVVHNNKRYFFHESKIVNNNKS